MNEKNKRKRKEKNIEKERNKKGTKCPKAK